MKDSQKTVIITGAGSGIGAHTARSFMKRNWFVGLMDVNVDSVKALAKELGEENCFVAQMDVLDKEAVQAGIEQFCQKTNGRLDAFINNAGLFHDCIFMELERDYCETMMRVNMEGVVNGSYAAYPFLKKTPDSYLVNIASVGSISGAPMNTIYNGTKFFVRGFSEGLRIDWERDDITVNLVMPGFIKTPMYDLVHDNSRAHIDKLIITPEEAAEQVVLSATSKKMYRIFPFQFRLMQMAVKITPLNLVPSLLKRLFKFK